MASDHPESPEADRAAQVMRSIQREREETVAVPGRTIDRFLARLIDGVTVALLGYVAAGAYELVRLAVVGPSPMSFAPPVPEASFGPQAINAVIVFSWLAIVAGVIAYEVLWARVFGATPGRRRTQLRIVDARTFEPASRRALMLRTVVWAAPLSFGILNWYYSVFFAWTSIAVFIGMYLWRYREDSGGRPLWDVVAGTHVITLDAPVRTVEETGRLPIAPRDYRP